MTSSGGKKSAATWQRVIAGLLSAGALLGIVTQIIAGISLELGNFYYLIRMAAALVKLSFHPIFTAPIAIDISSL